MALNVKRAAALAAAQCLVCSLAGAEGMTPGTYTGSANGMDGQITVSVTVDETAIQSIDVVDENETEGVGDEALQLLAAQITSAQSLGVDSIAGATVSSAAMKSAVAAALTEAGADASEWKKREVPVEVKDETLQYDVVVVGGGIAGMVTAIRAKEAGANVAIVEKLGVMGGSGVFSSGIFLGAQTAEQVPTFVSKWVSRNKIQDRNQVNTARVEAMGAIAPDALVLLTNAGMQYTYQEDSSFCFSTATEKAEKNASTIRLATAGVSAKGGAQAMNALEQRLYDLGVDVYMNTPATELVTDNGAVTGVICRAKTGTKTFQAKSVVLCTGGYARNNDLTLQLAEDAGYNYTAACAGDTGDGITMALAVGAAKSDFNESMSGVFCADPYDMPTIGQKNNSYPFSCLLVNSKAERPISETAGTHDQMINFIDYGVADHGWVIMDQEIADSFLNLDTYLERTSDKSYIKAYKADSIEALAGMMGVDAATLQATVTRYNELCAAGEDKDCGKDAKYLSAIDDGTYYAVKEYDMTRSNYGGIKTDLTGAVVNEAGEAIPGLYAAGIISSGDTFGDYYPGGEALAVGVYMGYISGTNAAANAAK